LAPPPNMKLWLPWSELNGSARLTLEEFRAALRDYPRSAILIACARLSTIFKFGPEANTVASQEINEHWVPRLMRPDLVGRAMQEVKKERPIFFQGQLRFLAAEAMRLDPAPAENGSQVPDWALGALLLGAGELLYKKHVANLPDELDVMANLVAEFLPVFEIDSITDPFLLFLRFYIYLNRHNSAAACESESLRCRGGVREGPSLPAEALQPICVRLHRSRDERAHPSQNRRGAGSGHADLVVQEDNPHE
jgi:hypothetical protein